MNIGIVGAGGMAAYHVKGFQKAGATVAAVADSNAERAGQFAQQWGIARTYPSLETMLAQLHCDPEQVPCTAYHPSPRGGQACVL